MLPPDFYERKRAAQDKSARMRALNKLRDSGIEPDTFPHRFLTRAESDSLWDAPPVDSIEEVVGGWQTVSGEIAIWARSQPRVAVFLCEASTYLVLPGSVLADMIQAFHNSAMHGWFYISTPDGSSGRLYYEGEHENSIRRWDFPTRPMVVQS